MKKAYLKLHARQMVSNLLRTEKEKLVGISGEKPVFFGGKNASESKIAGEKKNRPYLILRTGFIRFGTGRKGIRR